MSKVHRCGLVALVGAPNVGKSTLLNALVGDKLSIVSPKPQTTRLNLRGILSRPEYQMVFVDTPGLLTPTNPLEKGMRSAAESALKEADWVLLLASLDTEKELLKLQNLKLPKERSLLLLTKLDALSKDQALGLALRLLDALNLSEVMKVSAKSGEGLEALLELLASRLPEGPSLFPEDELSDTNIRELCAEIVREKALFLTRDEVPHALAVALDRYVEREDGLHQIEATLYVERESQKGIVIGAQGKLLKEIGTAARKDMERLVGAKVFLKLWVKVRKDWKKDTRFLKELGLHSEKAS